MRGRRWTTNLLQLHRRALPRRCYRWAAHIISAEAQETPEPPFELFEHTADAGIVARAGTLPELFVNTALGMFSLMVTLDTVDEHERRLIRCEAPDREALLIRWLSELLYYVDAEELLFKRFEVRSVTDTSITAVAYGEKIDRARHDLHFGVKAVTRHLLRITDTTTGLEARILFDI